jgi:tRNA A-37 threonylcarbamoyl transferase component Bud32
MTLTLKPHVTAWEHFEFEPFLPVPEISVNFSWPKFDIKTKKPYEEEFSNWFSSKNLSEFEDYFKNTLKINDIHGLAYVDESDLQSLPTSAPIKRKLLSSIEILKNESLPLRLSNSNNNNLNNNSEPIPTIDPKYLIKTAEIIKDSESLGKGIGGEVFRATYHGSPVVLKEGKSVEETLREVHNLQICPPHPGICYFYGVCLEEGNRWIVLEYISGSSLDKCSDEIRENFIDKIENFIPFCHSFATLIAALHSKGVVHADLSARNTMITPEGKFKLIDFGLMGKVVDFCDIRNRKKPVKWSAPEGIKNIKIFFIN